MKPAALRRMTHLAAWREREAQTRDLPRNRILRDETILDLCGTNPSTKDEFGKIRNFPGGAKWQAGKPGPENTSRGGCHAGQHPS